MSTCKDALELNAKISEKNQKIASKYNTDMYNAVAANNVCQVNAEYERATINSYADVYGTTLANAIGAPHPDSFPEFTNGFSGGWRKNRLKTGKWAITNGNNLFSCPLASSSNKQACIYVLGTTDEQTGMRQCCLNNNNECNYGESGIDESCWVGCVPGFESCYSDLTNKNKTLPENLFKKEKESTMAAIQQKLTTCLVPIPQAPVYEPVSNIQCCQSQDFSGISARDIVFNKVKNSCYINDGGPLDDGSTPKLGMLAIIGIVFGALIIIIGLGLLVYVIYNR